MKVLGWIAFLLMFVGGVNWGLVGFFDYNLVEVLLGQWPMVVKVVYGAVGVASLFGLVAHFSCCKGKECCGSGECK